MGLPVTLSAEGICDPIERPRLAFMLRLPFLLPIDEEILHRFPVTDHLDADTGMLSVDVSVRHVPVEAPPSLEPQAGTGFDVVAKCPGWPLPDWQAIAAEHIRIERTWVRLEIETQDTLDNGQSVLRALFESCLSELNRLIRAANHVADTKLPMLRCEQLEPLVPVEQFDPSTQQWTKCQLLLLRLPRLGSATRLTTHQEHQLNAAINVQGAPGVMRNLVRQRDWLERAKHARSEGDYEGAVVALQTSAEILMRAVHYLVLVDERRTAAHIETVTSQKATSFNKLYTKVLPGLLGGDWNSPSSAAVIYSRDLYAARNDIAHAGRALTRRDYEAASKAYDGLVELINTRLLHVPIRYPRTALALLGQPGLERRSRWNGYFEQFANSLKDEPDVFWLPYDVREAPVLSLLVVRSKPGAWGWYVIDRAWRLAAPVSEPEGLDEGEWDFLTAGIAQVDKDQPQGVITVEVREFEAVPPTGPVWFPIARVFSGQVTDATPELKHHPRFQEVRR
jgi:hypothetical protein